MTKIWRGVRRSFLTRALTIATTTMVVLAAIGFCTTVFAQNPIPNPPQVGQKPWTILGTGHDFTSETWLGTGDNSCFPCHGVPGAGDSTPVWSHFYAGGAGGLDPTALGAARYDASSWLRSGIDDLPGAVAFGDLSRKCLGCHEGATGYALDEYVGTPGTTAYMDASESLDTNLGSTHHPVGILYTSGAAAAVGYLKNPSTTSNPQGGGHLDDTLLGPGGNIDCNSCHEQHNDRRFDLIGDSNKDDPQPGATSEEHNFLKLNQGGCRVCHASGSEAAAYTETLMHNYPTNSDPPHLGGRTHHFPGRDDPWGDARKTNGFVFSCNYCHDLGDGSGNHTHPCADCHNDFPVRDAAEAGPATMATGHHGGDRFSPYIDCAVCHADPVTGLLTGNAFGSKDNAPSCFECHGELWFAGDTGAPTVTAINGVAAGGDLTVYADQLSTLKATATDPDSAEQILAYTWSFGDGSVADFPSFDNSTTHTYEYYNYNSHGANSPIMTLTVAVTDGVNPPETLSVNLVVKPAPSSGGPDTWTVTVDPSGTPETFDISIEDHDGALVVVQESGANKGQLAYGVQFGSVIFWMELWMDLGDAAYWGTGDMYFGNVNGSTMSGVVLRTDGSVVLFNAN